MVLEKKNILKIENNWIVIYYKLTERLNKLFNRGTELVLYRPAEVGFFNKI